MAAEMGLRDGQLEANLRKMKDDIKRVEKLEGASRASEIENLEEQCKECDTILDFMRMEFRSLGQEDKNKYRQKIKQYKLDIKTLKNDLEWLKESANKKDLLAGKTDAYAAPDLETADGLMDHGRKLQQASVQSLQRSVGVVGDTEEIGRQTAQKLQSQTEQIKGMKDSLYEIDDMLKRSRVIITKMLKRTASSKVLWVLVFAIVVVVGLIIYFKLR